MIKKYFLILLSVSLIMISCTARESDQDTAISENEDKAPVTGSFGYVKKIDGLHVTGKPIDIDINTYSLKITGEVNNILSLSFDDVKSYDATIMEVELNCPDLFTDIGDWTGVPVSVLLDETGLKPEASRVTFISFDGKYRKTLPLTRVKEGDILVSYQFEGKEFTKIHGFPLRITAPGEAGAVWVKWLGEISVE
jgi:DMSO/TMAO reductase YedYZ molybdopterin-dependent catalytic subunit